MGSGNDRRNPYLVLGIPYGSGRAAATRAFAARSRRARRDVAFPYTIDDLTWALNQVEAQIDNPAAALDHFRVPANPKALAPPDGPGLLRPPLVPMPRTTAPSTEEDRAALREVMRAEVVHAYLQQLEEVDERKPVRSPFRTPDVQSSIHRPAALWPVFVVVALLLAGAAIAVAIVINHPSSSPRPSPTTTAAPTTTVPPTTTTPPTAPPPPTVGDALTSNGLTLAPHDPIDAFGLLCVVFDVSGGDPLVFLPEMTRVRLNGADVAPSLDITTGRAGLGPVYGDASPQTREVCWPATGWADTTYSIEYDYDVWQFSWQSPGP